MEYAPVRFEENSTVDDDDILLRRVPKRPSCIESDNAGGYIIKVDAFQYDHGTKARGHSGVSVSLRSVWEGVGLPDKKKRAQQHSTWPKIIRSRLDWNEFGLAALSAATVRRPIFIELEQGVITEVTAGNIYRDPVDGDDGHALIRITADDSKKNLRRKYWLPLRSRLREAAIFYDLPMNVPSISGS